MHPMPPLSFFGSVDKSHEWEGAQGSQRGLGLASACPQCIPPTLRERSLALAPTHWGSLCDLLQVN